MAFLTGDNKAARVEWDNVLSFPLKEKIRTETSIVRETCAAVLCRFFGNVEKIRPNVFFFAQYQPAYDVPKKIIRHVFFSFYIQRKKIGKTSNLCYFRIKIEIENNELMVVCRYLH